jgi:hypothetical protein
MGQHLPAALEGDPSAVRRPRRIAGARRNARTQQSSPSAVRVDGQLARHGAAEQALHRAACRRHYEEVERARAHAAERDPLAVRRPCCGVTRKIGTALVPGRHEVGTKTVRIAA